MICEKCGNEIDITKEFKVIEFKGKAIKGLHAQYIACIQCADIVISDVAELFTNELINDTITIYGCKVDWEGD